MQTPQSCPENDPIIHITIPYPQAHVVLKFIAITFQKDFLSIWGSGQYQHCNRNDAN